MKILFIHNSVAEYRLEFWRLLGKTVDLQLLVTDKNLEKKAYGFQKDLSGLNIDYLSDDNYTEWLNSVSNYDVAVLPPVDDTQAYKLSLEFIKAARRGNTKVVMWTEGWVWKKLPLHKIIKKGYISFLRKRICNKSDACIVSGSQSYKYMKGLGVNERKLAIAYDSSTSPKPAISDIRKLHGIPESSRIVLYLSRIMRQKGLDLLIDAFSNIADKYPDSYLLIAGDGGYKKYCEQLAETKAVKSRIKFVGKVEPIQRACYFKESDMLVLPSHADHGEIEIWGLVVNECLEQGCPIVTTTAVGSGYDLIDDSCGKFVTENSVDELAKGIEHVLSLPKGKVVANCKKRYEEFSVQKMADGFYDAFQKVVRL